MDNDLILIALSLVAGVAGTAMGGVLGAAFSSKGDPVTGKVLGFAGGVMIGVVGFEMLPEAAADVAYLGKFGYLVAIAALIMGMAAVGLICKLPDLIKRRKGGGVSAFAIGHALGETNDADRKGNRQLLRAGAVTMLAIALHNFPEGMAIGASGAKELGAGITVAIVIAVHNVPEGMAIGAPLGGGGVKKIKAILLAALAGAATFPGAILGIYLGGMGALASAICLAVAAGAMLFVTLDDIFKEAITLNGKFPSVGVALGIVCAAIFVFAL